MSVKFLGEEFTPSIKLPEPPPLPTAPNTLKHVKLWHILTWILEGKIKAYPNNRGKGTYSKKTSNAIYEDLKLFLLGECTLGYLKGQLCLADWHSRSVGLLKLLCEGKLTEQQLNTDISLRITNDVIPTYQGLDACEKHSSKQRINNPDFAYGFYIQLIKESVGSDCVEMMGDRMSTPISCMLYNFNAYPNPANRRNDWEYVYRSRKEASKIASVSASDFKVSDQDLKNLIEGIRFWHLLMRDLQIKCQSRTSKILQSTGLFGYFVCKYMSKPQFFKNKNNTLVHRMITNLTDFTENSANLCRGSHVQMADFIERVEKILKIS